MKKWYKSKSVWLGILVTVVATLELLQAWLLQGDFSAVGVVGLIIGITQIAVRTVTENRITL